MGKEIFSIGDLFRFKIVKETKILPDGKVLFEEQTMNKEENKYLSSIYLYSKEEETKQFTSGLSKENSMKLSPNKRLLSFLSTRGNDSAKPQIFIMSLSGGEALRYTNVPNGVKSFSWSSDGTKIVFSHRVNLDEQSEEEEKRSKEKKEQASEIEVKVKKLKKEEKEKKRIDPRVVDKIVYREGTSFKDDRSSQIYILDLETKKVERVTSGKKDYNSPIFNKDATKIFAVRRREEGQINDFYEHSILEVDIETKEEKELKTFFGWGTKIKLSPKGDWLSYLCTKTDEVVSTQNSELFILNIETKQEKWISEEIDNNVSHPVFDEENNYVFFVVDNWEKDSIYRYSIDRETNQLLYNPEGMIYSFDIDGKLGTIVLNISTKEDPSKLVTYDYVYKRAKTLISSNKNFLAGKTICETEEIRYEGFEGKEIQGWIVKPPNFEEEKKYPLIVEIHGGPHGTWSPHERSMWFEYQYFASRGYVIFYCNPQGSSGRGYDFRYIVENWGTKPAEDIMKGLDQVISKGYVEENNLFVTGGSYGGYMTAWLIGNYDKFTAAAPQRGVYNLVSFWSVTDVTRFTPDEIGAHPWEDVNKMWELSPIAYVDKVKTPTRIIHSENDFRVPISQAEEYYVSLLRLGVEAELIRYPEEGHELSRSGKPRHMKDRLEKIVNWFNKFKT